jgi:hypothetical protein
MPDEDRAAGAVEVGLGERERFADPEPGSPEQRDQRSGPQTVRCVAGGAHDRDDLIGRRRVGGVAYALVPWRSAVVVAGHGDSRAAMAGGVESDGFHHSTSYC